jgi:5-methylcytosine-specific restriction endonuclease McrA
VTDTREEQLVRLGLASIELSEEQLATYLKGKDDLGEVEKGSEVATGYKRCGSCGHAKKFYLFNKNSGSKTNTSGNCKACQKKSAAGSYSRTKKRRNYKKYYQENKDIKQKHARAYYEANKDELKVKHAKYLQTKGGKKVMAKAHAKRREALANNKGIPYTRAMVIDRDGVFLGQSSPVCYLCLDPIVDTSGSSLHIDHVVPVVEGGLDCITNVACTHNLCNLKREKDARLLTVAQVESIVSRAEAYIDAYPEKFE